MARLTRRLGLIHTISIASGALISSGLFVLPGIAHARAGPAVIVSYLIAGLLAVIGLLSIAEMATAMPKAGGDYFFISRSLGSGIGTMSGMLSWFSISMKAAFALIGIGVLAETMLPVDGRVVAGLFLVIFCFTNLHGVKQAANLQVVLAGLLLVLLTGFVVIGIGRVEMKNFTPFAPEGWTAVFGTAGFVFVAFGAAMKVASMSEEIEKPGHNVPRGIGLSILLVALLYVGVVGVATGVLPGDKLDHSMTPISDAAVAFLGRPGYIAMSLGALLAFLTTANAGIMTASRYLLALSEDQLAPPPLSRLRKKSGTPWIAILTTSGLLALAILLPLDVLVESASVVFVVMYILASLSIVVLREGHVQNYRPVFKAPFYPYLQVIGIIGFVFVLFEMGEEAFLVAGILIIAALSLYWFYGRNRRNAESAMVHLLERITDRELISGDLEDELREVIRDRDRKKLDRMDRVVRNSTILDLDGGMDRKVFFKKAAHILGPTAKHDPMDLVQKLEQRDDKAGSVLRPGISVSYALTDESSVYGMVAARCSDGIHFPGEPDPVHAAFVIITSRDNCDFHVKVLAGLAQLVQAPEFDTNWMHARDEERLRDLLLLEERMRIP